MSGGIKTDVKSYQMYINGEWTASKSAKTFPVYDPSTEEIIAQVPDASADDVSRADLAEVGDQEIAHRHMPFHPRALLSIRAKRILAD